MQHRILGTAAHPLENREQIPIAKAFVRDQWMDRGMCRIMYHRGRWLHWDGLVWKMEEREWLLRELQEWLEDALYQTVNAEGVVQLKRVAPTVAFVKDVLTAVEGVVWMESGVKTPFWLREKDGEAIDPLHCVTYDDVVLNVKASAQRGVSVVFPRGVEWVEPNPMPVKFNPKTSGGELTRKVIGEWGGGDEAWEELLWRFLGYAHMGTRKYARMLLLHGKVRGGKSTIVRMGLQRLMPTDAILAGSMEHLTQSFGLDGVHTKKVVLVNEINQLGRSAAASFNQFHKAMLGGDVVPARGLYQSWVRAEVPAVPVWVANEIPTLPDKGTGLSSKILVLPFTRSWKGKEVFDLEERLWKEDREYWGYQVGMGAVRLEAEGDPGKKWPTPGAAEEVWERWRAMNNPADSFLGSRFVRNEGGFVHTDMVWKEWRDWKGKMGLKMDVARNMFVGWLTEETSWDVRKVKKSVGEERRWSLAGISLRVRARDEEA